MSRGQRSAQQHGWFHLTDHGVDRQDIFIDDREHRTFLFELANAAERFDVEIHAYCVVTTHFHVVVNCPEGGLFDFMQRALQRFDPRLEMLADRALRELWATAFATRVA